MRTLSRIVVSVSGCLVSFGAGMSLGESNHYASQALGVSFEPPAFEPATPPAGDLVAMFVAPPRDGFSDNLNVVAQAPMGRDEYAKASRAGCEAQGWNVDQIKPVEVAGREALRMSYHGEQNGRDLRFESIAVFFDERVVLLTGTAALKSAAARKPLFEKSFETFALLAPQAGPAGEPAEKPGEEKPAPDQPR